MKSDMTILEDLVYLAQLSNQLSRYKSLPKQQPLTRMIASYESTKALYDVEVAKASYKKSFDLIAKLQMAIDLTNLTTEADC